MTNQTNKAKQRAKRKAKIKQLVEMLRPAVMEQEFQVFSPKQTAMNVEPLVFRVPK